MEFDSLTHQSVAQTRDTERMEFLREQADAYEAQAADSAADVDLARKAFLYLSARMDLLLFSLRPLQERAVEIACYGVIWSGLVIWFNPHLAVGGMCVAMLIVWRALALELLYMFDGANRRYVRLTYRRKKESAAHFGALAHAARSEIARIENRTNVPRLAVPLGIAPDLDDKRGDDLSSSHRP